MKYKDWLKEWLANYVKPSSKQRTYQRYADIIRLHINQRLGNCELADLTPLFLQKYIMELLESGNILTGKGLSTNTVNAIINVIQSSLRTAYNVGLIPAYNGDKIKRPKGREKEISCFSLTEQRKLEQAVIATKKPKLLGILLCLYTGLRIGELLALKWSDFDFSQKTLTVSRNCHDGVDENGKYCRIIDTPKTASSKRVIPLPKQIVPYLKKARKASDEFVICSNGVPITIRSYQRSFELLQKKLHIPHRGFHALRHTFATRALECGMDIKTLSEILGHKSPTVTMNRYAHSLMKHKTDMMNALGKLFQP